jgi:hypothetical protein
LVRSCAWFELVAGGLALCWVAGGLVGLELAVPLWGRDVSVLLAALVPEPLDPEDGALLWALCDDGADVEDCCVCEVLCCDCAVPDGVEVEGAADLSCDGVACCEVVPALGACAKAELASTSPKAVVANRRIMVLSLCVR